MPSSDADRDLLFCVLAVRMGVISPQSLVTVTSEWVKNKTMSLPQVLLDQKLLDDDSHRLLVQLVDKHLQAHSHDPNLTSGESLDDSVREHPSKREDCVDAGQRRVAEAPTQGPNQANHTVNKGGDPNATRVSSEISPEPQRRTLSADGKRFRVIRPHAKGGLGQVSLAMDEELRREVALKEIQSHHADNSDNRFRFVQEAEITGRLEHPGIVPVYGMGEYSNGRPYYAMQFVRGESFKDAIERFHEQDPSKQARFDQGERGVEFRQLLAHFVAVCNTVEYVHNRGILHRDLKPDNVMLGKYGETLVVDWGLAKAIDEEEMEIYSDEFVLRPSFDSSSAPTQMGTVIGTPAFMSPEQARGKLNELGPTSDVYSLGATLYFLMTGQAPFVNGRVEIVLIKVERGDFPRPREIRPQIPPAMEAICLKAMARETSARYRSPQELARDVERCLADEAVSAYVDPTRARVGRWMRKHPTLVTAAALTILLGLIGSASVLGVVSQKNVELAEANNGLLSANASERTAKSQAEAARASAESVAAQLAKSNEQLQVANKGEREARTEAQLAARKLEAANDDLRSANAAERQAQQQAEKKRQEAEVARQRAQESREQATAVTRYLVNAFRSPDPAIDGRTITVAEVLDRAVAELDDHLQDDPLVTASLADAIGQTYRGLGLYDQAIELLVLARDTRTRILGATQEDSLESTSNLATAYLVAGQFDEAIPLFEACYGAWEKKLGHDDRLTLKGMNDLATAYRLVGQLPKALALSEQSLDIMQEQLGLDDRQTLIAMDNLATTYRAADRLPEALPLFEEALRRAKESLGPDDTHTVQATNNLAAAYQDDGQLPKAILLFEQTLELDRTKFGDNHPNTLKSMGNLAACYFVAGEQTKAMPLLQESFDLANKKLGFDHPNTLKAMNNLAAGYFVVGQRAKAMPLLEEGFQKTRAKLGPDHPDTLKALRNIVDAYRDSSEVEKALPHLETTLALVISKLGSDDDIARDLMRRLATHYLDAKQPAKALQTFERWLHGQRTDGPLFASKLAAVVHELLKYQQFEAAEKYGRECVEILQKKTPNHWMLFAAQSMLGEALAGQKKFSTAESLLIEGYEGLSKAGGDESATNLAEAVQRLIAFYEAREQPAEAAKWRAVLKRQ